MKNTLKISLSVFFAIFMLNTTAQGTAWDRAAKIEKGYNFAAWFKVGCLIPYFADVMGLEYNESCNVVTRPEPPPDSCNVFHETFDGAPDSPNSFYGDSNWAIYIQETNSQYTLPESIADHGPNCEPPVHFNPSDTHDTTHVVTDFEDAVYMCSNHLMTNIKGPGFGLINMMPNHLIDFSEGEAVISVDISTANTAPGRDWWNLTLQNPDDFDPLSGFEFAKAKNMLEIKRTFGEVLAISLRDGNFNEINLPRVNYLGVQTLIDVSKTIRTTFELRIQTNHIKLGMKLPDNQGYYWWVDTNVDADGNPLNLSWDKAHVLLGHHSYNPRKDGGMENTWHWDNVSMSPTVPFTLIGTDARFADSNNPVLNLDAPAPADAQLVLTSPDRELIGESLTVSFDGGTTWNNLTKVINSKYDLTSIGGSSYAVFKIPIPEGTTQLTFTGVDNHWQNWMAKDVYVISYTPLDCDNTLCPSLLSLDGIINNPTYHAADTVTSSGTIPQGANVSCKAGEIIIMEAGFSVENNADFSAEIEDCGDY